MICQNCHKETFDESVFCHFCGTKIIREKTCPSCKAVMPEEAGFCFKCGQKLTPNAPEPEASLSQVASAQTASLPRCEKPPKAGPFKLKNILIAAGILFCLAAAFVGVFLWTGRTITRQYDLVDAPQTTAADLLIHLPEQNFLQNSWRKYLIQDFSRYTGEYWEIKYRYGRPISIENHWKNQKRSFRQRFSYNEKVFTRFELQYGSDTANFKAYFFKEQVNFRLNHFYYAAYLTYTFEKNRISLVTLYNNIDREVGFVRFQYSDQGRNLKITTTYLDQNQNRTNLENGKCQIIRVKDPRGNLLEETTYDQNGAPAEDLDHIASHRYQYDPRGNRITDWRYDKKKQLLEMYHYQYDRVNQLLKQSYYDPDQNLKENQVGCAFIRYRYDGRGHKTEEANYDKTGNLCGGKTPIAITRYRYNERGNIIEKAYYDKNGNPAEAGDKIAKFRYKFDKDENRIEEAHYDKNGNLTGGSDQIAIIRYSYDDHRYNIEKAYYDPNGALTVNSYRIAMYRSQYDVLGNEIQISLYDKTGNLSGGDDDYAIYRYRYDAKGNEVSWTAYDQNDKPTKSGYANSGGISTYDQNRNLIEYSYTGLKGEIVSVTIDGVANVYKLRYERDLFGKTRRTLYLGKNDRVIVSK